MTTETIAGEPGRLDAVVARLTGLPRADVQRAIAAGRVTVDGARAPEVVPARGWRADRGRPRRRASRSSPEEPPVPVRYEDDAPARDREAQRARHAPDREPADGHPREPAARHGRARCPPAAARCVRASSTGSTRGRAGLMVVALTDEAHEAPARRCSAAHEVDRRYLALVRGGPDHDAFAVDAPLGRRADTGRSWTTATVARPRPRSRSGSGSAARRCSRRPRAPDARTRSGCTCAAIGHPILGDRAYGGGGDDATALGLTRPFLHSWRIAFDHPVTGERIELEEPLPEDLEAALGRARARRDLRP